MTFEREWLELISSARNVSSYDDGPVHQEHLLQLLSALYHPGLVRTKRLESDLLNLRQRLPFDSSQFHLNSSLKATSAAVCEQVRLAICQKPHVILAYAWVLYMALFSGGRWMRSEMIKAGPSFWRTPSQKRNSCSVPSEKPSTGEDPFGCLSFWFFDTGTNDGLLLKDEFKHKFEDIAAQLDEKQKADIIDESVNVFRLCSTLIGALDGTFLHQGHTRPSAIPPLLSSRPSLHNLLHRDSQTLLCFTAISIGLLFLFYHTVLQGRGSQTGFSSLGDW